MYLLSHLRLQKFINTDRNSTQKRIIFYLSFNQVLQEWQHHMLRTGVVFLRDDESVEPRTNAMSATVSGHLVLNASLQHALSAIVLLVHYLHWRVIRPRPLFHDHHVHIFSKHLTIWGIPHSIVSKIHLPTVGDIEIVSLKRWRCAL